MHVSGPVGLGALHIEDAKIQEKYKQTISNSALLIGPSVNCLQRLVFLHPQCVKRLKITGLYVKGRRGEQNK